MTRISVMLVDDHAVVRQGLAAYFDTLPDLEIVGEACNGAEAVRLAGEFAPDVVLMDLGMPGIDGVEATRQVKHISPHTHVIILTSYHDDDHIFPALRAGASSYLLKDVRMEALAEAVRRAAAGEPSLHPRIAARVILGVQAGRAEQPNPYLELTDRELDVLRLIADGLSNTEITRRLVISENTVKGHVSNILSKLHLADRTQAAVYAWKQGLVRRDG